MLAHLALTLTLLTIAPVEKAVVDRHTTVEKVVAVDHRIMGEKVEVVVAHPITVEEEEEGSYRRLSDPLRSSIHHQ